MRLAFNGPVIGIIVLSILASGLARRLTRDVAEPGSMQGLLLGVVVLLAVSTVLTRLFEAQGWLSLKEDTPQLPGL